MTRPCANRKTRSTTSIPSAGSGTAFNYQLIDLFGTPYPGDKGPGRTYVQNYTGADLYNWFVIDRPSACPNT